MSGYVWDSMSKSFSASSTNVADIDAGQGCQDLYAATWCGVPLCQAPPAAHHCSQYSRSSPAMPNHPACRRRFS